MKKHFTILCLSSSLVLLGMASTSKVSASNVNDIHNEVLPSTDLINGSQSTKNSSSQMRTELAGLSNYLNFNMIMNGSWDNRLSNSAMNPGQWKDWAVAKVNNDMVFSSGPSIAVNQSTFENKTSQTQVLSTPSFKETKSDTVTTTTTSSTGSSITTSAEMSFPFGGSSISMTVDYNYSTTNSVETSVTKEWEVPSQVVEVPAGKTYRIRWVFNQATARGTTDLNSHVTGIVNYIISKGETRQERSILHTIQQEMQLPSMIKFLKQQYGQIDRSGIKVEILQLEGGEHHDMLQTTEPHLIQL